MKNNLENNKLSGWRYIGAALIFGSTLGFQFAMVQTGHGLSGWLALAASY